VTVSSSSTEEGIGAAPSAYIQCTENWLCGQWNPCINGMQARTCSDLNSCGTAVNKPAEQQICGACNENWNCTEFSPCINGTQTRVCTDFSNCGTVMNRSAETQSCEVPSPVESAKIFLESAFEKVKNGAVNAFNLAKTNAIMAFMAVKTNPVLLIPIVGGILFIIMLIKLSPLGADFLRSIKIIDTGKLRELHSKQHLKKKKK